MWRLTVLLATCVATGAALSAGVARRISAAQATPVCASPSLPARRLGQLSMQVNDAYGWWGVPDERPERSAAYRAHQRAMRNQISQQYQSPPPFHTDLAAPGDGFFLMIFNAGQQNEGVYTQTQTHREGTYVLAFECSDDAHRFAQELVSQGFDLATPLFWSADRLSSFCRTSGMEVWQVPRGTLPQPPDNTFERPADSYTGSTSNYDRMRANIPRGDPEPMGPGGGRSDPYNSYRMWLEDLIHRPDVDCEDDDHCIIR